MNLLRIATGHAANSKTWKNKKMAWPKLVEKLTTEHKTKETFKEFISASKDEQHKIKDVGGYVGGYLKDGRRHPQNVEARQLLTLDLDFAPVDFWDFFTLCYGEAAVLHGTHKHHHNKPRLRLIMPLDREVTADEYSAIARRVAGTLGIDYFDTTTFEVNRLMFWPSTPSDVEYYWREQQGPWLNADQVLASYKDWKNASEWPTAEAHIKGLKNKLIKQQDPTEKTGIIGSFCRTYNIHEAIGTFLNAEYAATDQPDRYTYAGGSTASGLVVYDDKYAYSHHGTDPTSGQLCNAYDLVRIHKFGENGDSVDRMKDLILNDTFVKDTIAAEQRKSVSVDFGAEDLTWMRELDVNKNTGKYKNSAGNVILILQNDSNLKGLFKYNTFNYKPYLMRSTVWRKIKSPEPVRNVDFAGVRNYIERVYGITGVQKIDDALLLEFESNVYHPVKEYLAGIKWDGSKRVDSLLIDYFGADDTLYTREAVRKTLCGAVARVFDPGVKFDLVLTLVGKQGTGKSTFINKLGSGWSSDSFTTVKGKEAFEQLQGSWLIEIAELSGLKKAEIESVKHFLSKQDDIFRPAYGRITETYKRQCVFFGTTNNKDFLRDPSGNRRFMPIDVNRGKKDVFGITQDEVDQIWAEAVNIYQKGEALYLSRDAEVLARGEQKRHSETDERAGIIEKYINMSVPETWKDLDLFQRRDYFEQGEYIGEPRDFICVAEVWCECLMKNRDDMDRYRTREINDIMKGLEDWEQSLSTKTFGAYGTQKYYRRL